MIKTIALYILIVIAAYFLGSINFGIVISNLIGGDIRKTGSGNAGATNMTRAYGWKAGLLTMSADMLKCFVALWLAKTVVGDWGLMAAGIAVISGHCFPAFHSFQGGKGISVGAIIGLMISWKVFLCIFTAFFVFALITRKVSAGSIAAAITLTASTIAFGSSLPLCLLAAFSMTLALYRHLPNIRRLISGEEPDFKAGKEKL